MWASAVSFKEPCQYLLLSSSYKALKDYGTCPRLHNKGGEETLNSGQSASNKAILAQISSARVNQVNVRWMKRPILKKLNSSHSLPQKRLKATYNPMTAFKRAAAHRNQICSQSRVTDLSISITF
jgi:hypothetical protein